MFIVIGMVYDGTLNRKQLKKQKEEWLRMENLMGGIIGIALGIGFSIGLQFKILREVWLLKQKPWCVKMDMSNVMVCPVCRVVVSKKSYHNHISRKRCLAQHQREWKEER